MIDKKRIAKNSLYLSTGVVIGMFCSFLSIRYALDNIGVRDYGIYSIVGSVTSGLLILNNILASGTQRFLSYELGRRDCDAVRAQFNAAVMLHLLLALCLVVVAAFGMEVFLGRLLRIPSERKGAAHIVFFFMVGNIVVTILSTPFLAALTAREDMKRVTHLNISRSALMLAASVGLYFITGDKLVTYSGMVFGISTLIVAAQLLLVLRNYPEFSFDIRLLWRLQTMKSQLSFSSWNSFGAFASVAQQQGIAILLNRFFDPAINASFSIANQIAVQLSSFSTMLMKAIRPQMVKAEGGGYRTQLQELAVWGGNLATFVLSLIAIPVFIELEYLLSVWLDVVPPLTLEFCRIIIIAAWVNQLTIGLIAAIQAVGRIALYQAVLGTALISALPLAYLALIAQFSADAALSSLIVVAIIAAALRVAFSAKLVGLTYGAFLRRSLSTVFVVVTPAMALAVAAHGVMADGWMRVGAVTGVFATVSMLVGWRMILSKRERDFLKSLFDRIRDRQKQ